MRLREARELVRTTQLGASVVMKGVVTEILNTVRRFVLQLLD